MTCLLKKHYRSVISPRIGVYWLSNISCEALDNGEHLAARDYPKRGVRFGYEADQVQVATENRSATEATKIVARSYLKAEAAIQGFGRDSRDSLRAALDVGFGASACGTRIAPRENFQSSLHGGTFSGEEIDASYLVR